MAILTKSDILKGINNVQKVEIESLGGELYLRPLSSAELDEINYIEAEGMGLIEQNTRGSAASLANAKSTQTSKMNVLKLTKASNLAKYTMIKLSLDNPENKEKWEIDDIKLLPKDAVEEIHKKVQEICHIEIKEVDIKQFPED